MPNIENIEPHKLTPNSERTREVARKGGIASGRARRAKKNMRELAEVMMNSPAKGKMVAAAKQMGADLADEDVTNAAAILAGQMLAAVKGNTNAARFVVELMDGAARDDAMQDDALTRSLEELGRGL